MWSCLSCLQDRNRDILTFRIGKGANLAWLSSQNDNDRLFRSIQPQILTCREGSERFIIPLSKRNFRFALSR